MPRVGPKVSAAILLVVFWQCAAALEGAEPGAHPSAEELRRQAARCRELLRTSLLDFYLPGSVDILNGGYFENWREGRFQRRGQRFLTLQARQLWFFSTLAAENIERERCLEAALHGYLFLERNFRDPRLGGYYSTTDEAGAPVDTRKHLYHNSFALYALVAYHRATREAVPLRRAQELFQTLDQRAHDARNGGYHEFFHADWRPVTNPSESGYIGAIGTKTYNTHLHLLESFSALYRVSAGPLLRDRLGELIHINTSTVRHPAHPCNIDGWLPDWRMVDDPRNGRASYGHDVECIWLVLEAARAIGSPEALYRSWAESLAGYSLEHGYDSEHGGFYYTGPVGEPADETRKEWWVQAEALVGMLDLYRLTGNPRHYEAFARTLEFVAQHQIAPDGGWWATRNANGSPAQNTSRTSMWHGAYHSGRALLYCSQLLSTLNPSTN
jgi:mannobiose 2-epimerase